MTADLGGVLPELASRRSLVAQGQRTGRRRPPTSGAHRRPAILWRVGCRYG
ncbi:MAG TPA: hypothetical protein PLP01_14785 [Phycisphaerae bacterium]|nr:hypothetical protein [Phycisphaerae bacterium]